MNNQDYTPNSHKYKAEQKAAAEERRVEKVINGTVKTKKKSGIHKFTDVFIAEDASSVKSYILMDVLLPAFKKAISDVVTNGIDMLLYGGSGRGKKAGGDKISYRNYYDKGDNRFAAATVRPRFDYDDIVFNTRAEAEAVRDQMDAVIERYGFVTVADMYDMCELPQPHTSYKYGWEDIRNAEAVRLVGGGYILKLPKVGPLDR